MSSTRSRLILAFGVLATAFVSGGALLRRGMRPGAAPRATERLFDQVMGHVSRSFVDSFSTDRLFELALAGMLEELGDPHTTYLNSERLRRLEESTKGIYTGLGVRVDGRDGWPMVIAPLPGSPSERAGLLAGDRIVEIDGNSTRGWTDEETRGALRGPAGTSVALTVERPRSARRRRVIVSRGEIVRGSVRRVAVLPEGVGYVDLKIFSDSTGVEVARAVDSLVRAGVSSLVLDVRGNPGGLLTQGVAVSDLFLDPGRVIVDMRGRSPETTRIYGDSLPQRWPSLPLAVLVDEATASAAEIVAGALQDHDRAVVVGQPTFGKGSAQAVFQTLQGGGLKLTTARWYTPLGRSIERRPLADTVGAAGPGPAFTTREGRRVPGGGGITPDVAAGDSGLSPAELALQVALGDRVPEFRDALTAYAISLKGTGRVASPSFEVTPRMLDEAWVALRRRDFVLDRPVFDGARGLVSQLLAREVARYVLGPAAGEQRSIRDDAVIQRAAALVGGAATQGDAFRRVPRGQPR